MLSLKTCQKYLALNFCILVCYSYIIPVNEEKTEENCLKHVLSTMQEATVFMYSDILDYNLIHTKTAVFLKYSKNSFENVENHKINVYILQIYDYDMVENIFKKLKETFILNTKAKFLILYNETTELRKVFQEAWKYYIINLTIIVSTNSSIDMYTYFPYSLETLTPKHLGKCNRNIVAFPEKVPKYFQDLKLNIMAYPISPYVIKTNETRSNPNKAGLEVTILNAVAEKLNLSQKYVPNPYPHWGFRYLNSTYSFMYNSLYKKEVDIIFGFMYGNASYSLDFDPSFTHLTDTSVWWVPTALEIPNWKNITYIFENTLWIAIFLILLINAGSWYIIAKFKKETSFQDPILCLIIAMYCLLTGSSIRPHSWLLKNLFILWVIVSLLLVTAYQSQLVSVLTHPIYEKQISSLEGVVKSSLKIGFYPTIAEALQNENSKIKQEILKMYTPCGLDNTCIRRVAFQRDFCTFKNQRSGLFLLPKEFTFPNGRPMLYHFKQFGMLSVIRFYVNKGNPILDKIDEVLMQLASSGFINKWDADLRSTFKISEPDKIALNLGHLLGAFDVLLFGIVLSFVTFLCELVVFKITHKELEVNLL